MPHVSRVDRPAGVVTGVGAEPGGARFALLDGDGVIVEVSPAWAEFAVAHGGDLRTCCAGASYLEVCDALPGDPVATAVGAAIRLAAGGRVPTPHRFLSPCPGVGRSGWFELTVLPRADGRHGACVTVDETTLFVTTQDVDDGLLAGAFRAAAHSRDDLVARRLQHLAAHDLFQLTLRLSALADALGTPLEQEAVALVADVDRVIRVLLEWSTVLAGPTPPPEPPSG